MKIDTIKRIQTNSIIHHCTTKIGRYTYRYNQHTGKIERALTEALDRPLIGERGRPHWHGRFYNPWKEVE